MKKKLPSAFHTPSCIYPGFPSMHRYLFLFELIFSILHKMNTVFEPQSGALFTAFSPLYERNAVEFKTIKMIALVLRK